MAENTITSLFPSLFAGLDIVSRELTGFIPAAQRDARTDRAAKGQTVTYHVAPAGNSAAITPAMVVPDPTGQTIAPQTMTISDSKAAEFGFVGEDILALENNGAGFSEVQADMFAQALRVLVNEVETDLAVAALAGACRAYGTPQTEPFATNTAGLAQMGKILKDNGAPLSNLQCVLDTTAGANLQTLFNLNDNRDIANTPMNQQGILINSHGFAVRETGQGQSHTAGTGASATTDNAGYSVGDVTITLASAGTGTILVDDVISFAGDPNQYKVLTGDADVSGGGTVVLRSPGLMQAIAASTTAITVATDGASSPTKNWEARGVAFDRNALHLIARAPALPPGGDMASDRFMIVDPRSGLPFEVAVYKGYHKVRYEVGLSWGVEAVAGRHIAALIA